MSESFHFFEPDRRTGAGILELQAYLKTDRLLQFKIFPTLDALSSFSLSD